MLMKYKYAIKSLRKFQFLKPEQEFFVGDLVSVIRDEFPYFKVGMVGLITLARCTKMFAGLEAAGPIWVWEWHYVGRFGNDLPQGIKLDKLSPIKVIS